jgi:flagella basal body P-ring formation protein FlgA
MKTVLTILLLLYSFAQAYTLKQSYTYDSPTLYATDFFPEIKKDFEVVTIPEHLQHFQLSQKRLFDLFKRHGIILEGRALGLVKFRRYSDLDLSRLKREIRNYYLEHLPFLTIKKVKIQASRHITELPQNYRVVFKKQTYKHYRGTFKIISNRTRIFFKFSVDASYSQFQAKKRLRKGSLITAENTNMVIVPFKRLSSQLIGYDQLSKVEAKRYLKAGKAITLRDVRKVRLIKKGAIVNVKLIEGNILIHFTAKALKSGNLHETIEIKKNDGSKLRAKIIGKDEVTIE